MDEDNEEHSYEDDSTTDDNSYDSTANDEDEEEEVESNPDDARVSRPPRRQSPSRAADEAVIVVEDDEEDDEGKKSGTEVRKASGNGEGCSQGREWNRNDIDGLFCPICMEAWSNEGQHQICCLPCGHIYGMSCIRKWLLQRRSSNKCPQCNRKCSLKDVRKLYASQLVVIDEESQKKIRSLEAKCMLLDKKEYDWRKKEAEWKRQEADLSLKIKILEERAGLLERSVARIAAERSCVPSLSGHKPSLEIHGHRPSCSFGLQKEVRVDGARIFDIDAANHFILTARRLPHMGGNFVLSKTSLMSVSEMEDISLPSGTNAVRDLHVSPYNNGLALFASLGKKLSVLSAESNNVVLTYDLPAAAWSCSWDYRSPHLLYAGLQNGFLLVFDRRQTAGPLENLEGETSKPIHTIQSLPVNAAKPSSDRGVLTASAAGLCQWIEGRLSLVPQSADQGVCISLAYSPGSDDIVASYRPKVDVSGEFALTQASQPPSCHGLGVQGSHILFRRVDSGYQKLGSAHGNVAHIGFQKSAIVDVGNQNLFAFGDEFTSELLLHDLPSFAASQRLRVQKLPIRDVKFNAGSGLLGCLSEDKLELYNAKVL